MVLSVTIEESLKSTTRKGGIMIAETETLTITVSKHFVDDLREVAYLMADDGKLGETLEARCGWVLRNLCEQNASTAGELSELVQNRYWNSEFECRIAADRVQQKLRKTAILEVWRYGEGWQIAIFSTEYPHWHKLWKYCQAEGLDFDEERERETDRLWQKRRKAS
jgi:hypothetical protein